MPNVMEQRRINPPKGEGLKTLPPDYARLFLKHWGVDPQGYDSPDDREQCSPDPIWDEYWLDIGGEG